MLTVFVAVYVVVALVNYSLVQSLAGSVASNWLSQKSGGVVRIGSMGCNPFNHLILRNVELINPDNDTVCTAHTMSFRFKRFPYDEHGLSFSQVRLKDTYYHLGIDSMGLNLQFLIDAFASDEETPESQGPPVEFKVLVDDLIMDDVTYRHDLDADRSIWHQPRGDGLVNIKHQEWAHVKARMRNVRVDKDYVTCRIDRFITEERSGLRVNEMSMNVYATRAGISATNLVLQTDDSRLMGDVLLDFASWKTMKHFLDSVVFTCHFTEGSYGGLRDATFWTEALKGMDERIELSGWFGGPIADFHADDVHLAFGQESELELDAGICGLPHIDSTVITAAIRGLHTTYADLAAVRHPEGITMKAEKLVKQIEFIDADLTFAGTIYDFNATVDANTAPGPLRGDVMLAMNPRKGDYRYVGEVSSEGFHLGRVAPNEWVSRSGFELSFEGKGFNPRTMNASAQGRLTHTVLKGQRLTGETAIDVEAANGKMTAQLDLDDALAMLAVNGEMEWREKGPIYRANADIGHLDLKRLGFWTDTSDSESLVDAKISGFFSELGEGNSFARLTVSDVALHTTRQDFALKKATFVAREQNRWKSWTLGSDILSAQLRGYFQVAALGKTVSRFVDDYVPRVWNNDSRIASSAEPTDANFEFNAELNDTLDLLQLLVPGLMLATGTSVQANYNVGESFKPIVLSDSIGYGALRMYNVGISGESEADRYRLRATSDEIKVGELLLSENANLFAETSQSSAICRIVWENSSQTVGGGDVNLRFLSDSGRVSLVVDPSQLALSGNQWRLEPGVWDDSKERWKPQQGGETADDYIYLDNKGFYVGGLALLSDEQMLLLRASRRGEVGDSVDLTFRNFGLAVVNPFLAAAGLSVDGVATGDVKLGFLRTESSERKAEVPYLNADLGIERLTFDGEALGNARLQSTWNAEMNQLNLYVNTRRDDGTEPVQLVGYLDMGSADMGLNFNASVDGVALSAVEPFTRSFASNVVGNIYGEASIEGTLKAPHVDGYLLLKDGGMKIDFLNVTYGFSDTVHLDPDAIRFDGFEVRDERGNSAFVNGRINHNGLKDFDFDLFLTSDRLLCMNTSARHSEQYYGTVLAAVDGSVSGPTDNLDIVLSARTVEGSVLNVPINDKRQLKQADYIHFGSWSYESDEELQGSLWLNDDETEASSGSVVAETATNSNYLLTINVETTPEMRMKMPMDFSSVTVDIDARGGGDLQLQTGSSVPFTLKGDYEIIGGTVALDILGLLGKDFAIDEGSSITFPGTISDAMFDIKAVYSQRVNLSTLTGSLGASESQKPVQVENVIALSGSLQSPDIGFDLRLPNADQSVQEEVFAYIDRSNERDMLNQTVSLLLFKRFYNSSANTNTDLNSSTAEEGYGLVANTLGSMVSDMVQFVDINFDYQAGNAVTTEQYTVDINKEWNKFYFETTLGFGGEARELSSADGGNNMTGDMVVGYKINPRFHLFVFNRSNTNDYTRSDLPYKQGFGVKYTRDFDTLGELLRRKRKQK